LKINNKSYELSSICYFQKFHYIHVKNTSHPKILSLNSKGWLFRDGLLNARKLIDSSPHFKFHMRSEQKQNGGLDLKD